MSARSGGQALCAGVRRDANRYGPGRRSPTLRPPVLTAFLSRLPDDSAEILGYTGSLITVTVPSSIAGLRVRSIASEAFYSHPNLRGVTVPDGVTDIGNKVFYDCPKLREVSLPDTVRSMGTQVFCYCPSLTRANIPAGITELPRATFMCCENLVSIRIPDGVTTIGKNVFYGCENLASVTVPDTVTTIGQTAFHDCRSLEYLALSANVTSIYDDTSFSGCLRLVIDAPEGSYAYRWAVQNHRLAE